MEMLKAKWGRYVLARQNGVTSVVLLCFFGRKHSLTGIIAEISKTAVFFAWRLWRLRRRFQSTPVTLFCPLSSRGSLKPKFNTNTSGCCISPYLSKSASFVTSKNSAPTARRQITDCQATASTIHLFLLIQKWKKQKTEDLHLYSYTHMGKTLARKLDNNLPPSKKTAPTVLNSV